MERRLSMAMTGQSVLSEVVLARCAERAAIYDRDNRFFSEDFEELRAARYLVLAVPKELGAWGCPSPRPLRSNAVSPTTPPLLPSE
jgi:alkylation response protein AidB-like acyl-CoA dehydrogenase